MSASRVSSGSLYGISGTDGAMSFVGMIWRRDVGLSVCGNMK